MGCDIHTFLEYRVDGGAWQSHPDIKVDEEQDGDNTYRSVWMSTGIHRDYQLFAALAGVRGEGPEPSGIPTNLSPLVKEAIDNWDCDGHSHSYMSLEEFYTVLKQQEYDIKKLPIYKSCRKITRDLGKLDQILLDATKPSLVEHRVVFFFDN
jgi:hypothetical protein